MKNLKYVTSTIQRDIASKIDDSLFELLLLQPTAGILKLLMNRYLQRIVQHAPKPPSFDRQNNHHYSLYHLSAVFFFAGTFRSFVP